MYDCTARYAVGLPTLNHVGVNVSQYGTLCGAFVSVHTCATREQFKVNVMGWYQVDDGLIRMDESFVASVLLEPQGWMDQFIHSSIVA